MRPFIALLIVLCASAARAHAGDPAGISSFVAGFEHPLFGLEHLAAMLAVGMWSAQSLRQPLRGPLLFGVFLLLGALGTMAWGFTWPAVEPGIAVSLLVLGLLVAARSALPAWAGGLLIAAFALCHGAALDATQGGAPSGFWALAGLAVATVLLLAAGLVLGHLLKSGPALAARLLGAPVIVLGVARLAGAA